MLVSHRLVLGSSLPAPPLILVVVVVARDGGPRRCPSTPLSEVHAATVTFHAAAIVAARQPFSRMGAVDPLLKDLSEKKQNFRQNVVSLALASQEQCVVKEALIRQEAEMKAKKMEEEIIRLHEDIKERNFQL